MVDIMDEATIKLTTDLYIAKSLLIAAEDKIEKLKKENAKLKKQLNVESVNTESEETTKGFVPFMSIADMEKLESKFYITPEGKKYPLITQEDLDKLNKDSA